MKNTESIGLQVRDSADASTRQRVLSTLLTQGPMTAAELAADLELTAAAVRRHLDALVSEGSLQPREVRSRDPRGRGRPAKAFVLTEAGRARFHNSYSGMALQAIAELVRAVGPSGVDRLAESFFGSVGSEFAAMRSDSPSHSAAQVLAEALDESGFVASVDRLPSGEQLLQHHCPVADVARAYPQICEVETQLIARLTCSHVQRLATIARGDGVCTTHIPNPVARGDEHRRSREAAGRNRPLAKVEKV